MVFGTANAFCPRATPKFVSTPAPAWVADKRPIYGAFFWINGDGQYPVPRKSYYMAGAGGQTTMIVPSHDLVVVRMGHYKGKYRRRSFTKSAYAVDGSRARAQLKSSAQRDATHAISAQLRTPVLDTPSQQRTMMRAEFRRYQWTWWFGCRALALESMRLRSASLLRWSCLAFRGYRSPF